MKQIVIATLCFLNDHRPNDKALETIEFLKQRPQLTCKSGQSVDQLEEAIKQIAETYLESVEAILKPLDLHQLRQTESSSATPSTGRLESQAGQDKRRSEGTSVSQKLKATTISGKIYISEVPADRPHISIKSSIIELKANLILRLGTTFIEVVSANPQQLTLNVVHRRLPSKVSLTQDAKPSYSLGRHRDCDVRLRDTKVSSRHGTIRFDGSVWIYEDNHSRNGSWLSLHSVETLLRSKDSPLYEVTEGSELCDSGETFFKYKDVSSAVVKSSQ
jgi:hypothetical protein